MKNQELAKIFYAIADYLKMDDVPFKPAAYRRAAMSLENLEENIDEIYKRGGLPALEEIPGVGKSIAEKIEEFIKTGKIKYYEKLKKREPFDIEELSAVEGLGPKRAKFLYKKLGIRNLADLEKAAKAHKIASLPGFGDKQEKNILEGIEFLKRSKGRILLGRTIPLAEDFLKRLKSLKEVSQISLAGSIRRMKETIGDIDILIAAGGSFEKSSKTIMDFFISQPEAVKVWGRGPTRSSIRIKEGLDVDLRIVPLESYGAALQYFTGSKEHNIAIRRIAVEKGYKLNEYGLFKGQKKIAGFSEEEIYNILGFPFFPPEIREDNGEIDAALNNKLPNLIGYKDIKADLHCHSEWDGGENSILEIAEEMEKMGYSYFGISDHTKFLKIENGLDEKELFLQRIEINKLNKKFEKQGKKIKILQGIEANILNDGSLDINEKALEKLDYVIAGVHSNLKMAKEEMTKRIIKAMQNPYVNIISHPTGRIIRRRDEYQLDFRRILTAAKELNVALEINSSPERLDLKDVYIREAKKQGVKMIINTDAHQIDHIKNIKYGIAQARRGWAEKKDIINSWPLEKFLEFVKNKRKNAKK